MITHDLARDLARSGLPWKPMSGDRFWIPDRDLDDEVFVVSGMSIEASDLPSGTEMRFNGTVEWALDSVAQSEVVWLPREGQMREALGDRFVRMERLDQGPDGYVVVLVGEERYVDIDAERAYARALLTVLLGAAGSPPGS
jgi:hypothetical protein